MRIGSLTQAPRQPTRFGANPIFLVDAGFVRVAAVTGQEYAPGVNLSAPLGGIGHSISTQPFMKAPAFRGSFTLSGVTRDSAGVALGSCSVRLFKSGAFNEFIAETTSDGSGNFSFSVPSNSDNYWIACYKPGSPDVTGASVRSLVAA